MIQNIKPINQNSKVGDINNNFTAIQTAINNKQLAFHYLNLYNLKGSVIAEMNEITRAYNLLNLNEALLIVVNTDNNDAKPEEEKWRSNITLYAGDYLVKTTAGPLRIPGPTTGYYIPAVNENTGELTYTYSPIAPTTEEENLGPFNIRGASSNGYDLTFDLEVDTPKPFDAVSDIQPIIQIYDGNTLIDYPYTLVLSGTAPSKTYTLTITTPDGWADKTFTVRVR